MLSLKERDYNLNILGIRNQSGKADHFDDYLCVVYKVDDEWVVDSWAATTEPGTSILQKTDCIWVAQPSLCQINTVVSTRLILTAASEDTQPSVKDWACEDLERQQSRQNPDYEGPIQEGYVWN